MLEKTRSDTFKTTVAINDLVSNLLGEDKKLENSDDFPKTDEDCDAPPICRTLAVDVRGLDQTNARSGKQLVSAPPPSSKRRAEQNTKLRRHEDHQKSFIPGYRPSLRKDLRIPIQKPLQKASKTTRALGLKDFEATELALEELTFGRPPSDCGRLFVNLF